MSFGKISVTIEHTKSHIQSLSNREYIIYNINCKCIERSNLPKSDDLGIEFIPSNQKTKFNPLLYKCDLHKLKIIQDAISVKLTKNNRLQKLFHEVIKNDYLYHQHLIKKIKKQINYNEKDENSELILNDKILKILNELKILYHDDIQ
ncbi:hypothetical protein RFI_20342 [Reticulomyxa filosa]|uniref:Uncharacterized protein n=1 Tax=Reticulomyxa filosa TaxID=46433 RepID=X6MV72_RETFI|nr:hypothetical protein RFI_20342 [Reticulomyxa filosa]|eukprot:ETO16995.1 hypothetical protein RFI_20342 [Reticulomyxa filosa]